MANTWVDPNDHVPTRPTLNDPADPVREAEAAAYKALCACDDAPGDNPFCKVCVYVDDKYGDPS